MGRATIIGGGTDGLYSVRLDFGTGVRDARIVIIDLKIERLNLEIAQATDAIAVAEARTLEVAEILRVLIEQMVAAQLAENTGLLEGLKKQTENATSLYARVAAEEAALRVPRDMQIAERKELAATKGRLQLALIEETQQVWCTDLTQDATGEVATIEVPGEDRAILIAPGGRPPTSADGALRAREIMSPEQAFWNAAVLPGWQKWKPTYRKGTITALNEDDDTANVDLDPATSSANGLNVNQTESLEGVAVQYMECNAAVFTVGDRVVIGFDGMDWQFPRVIGFVDNPKPCQWVCIGSQPLTPLSTPDLFIKCLEDGLISRLISGVGVGVQCWLDGSGPFDMPVFVDASGAVSNFIRYYFRDGAGSGVAEGMKINFLSATGTEDVYEDSEFRFGAVSPTPVSGEENYWAIAEVVIKVDGEIKLQFAVTSMPFESGPPYMRQIKGVPIIVWDGSDIAVSRLTTYSFVGS